MQPLIAIRHQNSIKSTDFPQKLKGFSNRIVKNGVNGNKFQRRMKKTEGKAVVSQYGVILKTDNLELFAVKDPKEDSMNLLIYKRGAPLKRLIIIYLIT